MQVIAISKSVVKNEGEKIRQTLKAHILADSAHIWKLKVPHPKEICTKIHVWSGSVEVQMHENGTFTSVHNCLSRAMVSWAARHTTVCLDIISNNE